MNPTAQKYGAPALAGINLIPREIADRKKMRSVRGAAVMAVLVAVALVAGVFALALLQKQSAQDSLDDALTAETAAVQARDAKKPVYDAMRQREAREYALAQIGFADLDQAQLTAAIQGTADDESSFESIVIGPPTAAGFGGEGQDTLFGGGVGTVTFSARTISLEKATDLLMRLNDVVGLANVRGTTETYSQDGGEIIYTVEGSAVITDRLLTGRLMPEDAVTGADGLTIARAQDPESSASVAADAAATAEPTPEPSATEEEG